MRDSAGQLLGAMCGRLGTAVYEDVRGPTLELIRSNLERSEEVSKFNGLLGSFLCPRVRVVTFKELRAEGKVFLGKCSKTFW